jgi:hypothetical protein
LGIPGVTTFLTFGRLQDLPNQKRAFKKKKKTMKQSFLIGYPWKTMEDLFHGFAWISQSKSSVSWFYLFS